MRSAGKASASWLEPCAALDRLELYLEWCPWSELELSGVVCQAFQGKKKLVETS